MTHPAAELLARMRPSCRDAVDEIDVAVLLEVDGFNDAAAVRCGAADTRRLAEAVLAAVPTRVERRAPGGGTERGGARTARLAARGLLYAAPGVFYLAVAPEVRSPWTVLCLVGVTTGGWVLSQVLAVLAHRLRARTGAANTARVLHRSLLAGALLALAVFAATTPVSGAPVATVLASQTLYVVAATVLLFRDADRRLAVCLVPGSAAGLACLTPLVPPTPWLAPLLAALTAAATSIGGVTMLGDGTRAVRPAPTYPSAADLRASLPYAAYGAMCAAAIAFQPLAVALAPRPGGSAVDLAIVPLVLVMGLAEVEIRRLRRLGVAAAEASPTLSRYRRSALANLVRVEFRIGAAMAVLSAATMAALRGWSPAAAVQSAACLVLGCAMVAGLVACAFTRVRAAVTALATAFTVIAAVEIAWRPVDLASPPGQLAGSLVLLAFLAPAALRVLRSPVDVLG